MAKLMKAASRGIPLAARTPKWLAPHPSAIAPAAASGVRAASGIPRDAALLRSKRFTPTEMKHEGHEDHEEIVFVCFCGRFRVFVGNCL